MTEVVDYLVVGSGLTGATIARELADAGREVLVLDRRDHVGGNVHDSVGPGGIRVHTYGPHYFRTNSDRIWAFVRRFADFYPYEASLVSWVGGRHERWPVAAEYIERVIGADWRPGFVGTPANFEEASLAMMPERVYRDFVKGYTEKQWGMPAARLSAELARRFEVRDDGDHRLVRHRHQGIPVDGYATWTSRILDGIPTRLGVDHLTDPAAHRARRRTIFTGPIDELYGFDLGRLGYRGQRRDHEYRPDADLVQPCGQVNNPDPAQGPHVRTLEWKHMLHPDERAAAVGTVLTREVPVTPTDPNHYEYPVPEAANARLYRRYRDRAAADPSILVCGRLGEYRYYDMDQAIARARLLARRLLAEGSQG